MINEPEEKIKEKLIKKYIDGKSYDFLLQSLTLNGFNKTSAIEEL